jgi:hypothetical protein
MSTAILTWKPEPCGCARPSSSGQQEKSSWPPKSKAGRRVVGVPQAIIPVLREHLSVIVKGGPLRRCNFNKTSA